MANKPKNKKDKIKAPKLVKTESVTPADMIKMAVAGGADLEKLEKLMLLQERWEGNEAKKEYHIAMAAFKANPPRIEKDKTVGYQPKIGARVGYAHASLANVCDKINSELSKHGLSVSWTHRQNGTIAVTCKITHIKGHSEETTLAAGADTTGSKNSIQAIGSTITYLERYTLLSLTGLATCEQGDDGMASKNGKPELKKPEALDKGAPVSPTANLKPQPKNPSPKKESTVTSEPQHDLEASREAEEEPKEKALTLNERFKAARKGLGDKDYFHILKTHGFASIGEIKSADKAKEVLKIMEELYVIEETFKDD